MNCITPVKKTTNKYALIGSLRSASDRIRFEGRTDAMSAFMFEDQ